MPPLRDLIQICEGLASIARPFGSGSVPKVRAVALNTARLDEAEARLAMCSLENTLQLPCIDPIRMGGDQLLTAIRAV